jgi:hypothetical protein
MTDDRTIAPARRLSGAMAFLPIRVGTRRRAPFFCYCNVIAMAPLPRNGYVSLISLLFNIVERTRFYASFFVRLDTLSHIFKLNGIDEGIDACIQCLMLVLICIELRNS